MQPMQVSDDEWKARLTSEQYHVLREKGTEHPFSGEYLKNDAAGNYACAACGTVLFHSDAKYETAIPSLAGWPSFAEAIDSGAVELKDDHSFGMVRQEVICKTCGGHLGHVFEDSSSPSGQHFCINSAALDFKAARLSTET